MCVCVCVCVDVCAILFAIIQMENKFVKKKEKGTNGALNIQIYMHTNTHAYPNAIARL